jgi:hypothetical protein
MDNRPHIGRRVTTTDGLTLQTCIPILRLKLRASFGASPAPQPLRYRLISVLSLGNWAAQSKSAGSGLPSAQIARIPNADHYVFRSNEADVLREMNAFMDGLSQ